MNINDYSTTYYDATHVADMARTAWHPVSDPPTEGEDTDLVLVWHPNWSSCAVERVGNVRLLAYRGSRMWWARQRDVVLLPPTD